MRHKFLSSALLAVMAIWSANAELVQIANKPASDGLGGTSSGVYRIPAMAKYYGSELSMRNAQGAIAVLGGSGFMKDYPCERYLRDSRITTIYEGTSQLQVVAALFVKAAEKFDYKKPALEFWLNVEFPRVRAGLEQVMSGYVGSTAEFETLAPAVPAED